MIKHLDCTFRDGGYYNKWDFPDSIVNDYLKSMQLINVDYVELGFRSLNKEGYFGPFAFTKDDFIENFNIPSNIKIGVMVNASDLLNQNKIEENLNILFPNNSKNSKVELVRIACHAHEIKNTFIVSEFLKEKGFEVGFNLMQIADRTNEELINILEFAKNYPIDVFYIGDSTGSLDNKKTKNIINQIQLIWQKDIGIHAHDNLSLGLSNTMHAIESGANWVDSTITGMGRGPGNVNTEFLAIETNKIKNKANPNFSHLLDIIENYFKSLKASHLWGTNSYYYLAGKKGIHPTFVQEMINDKRYKSDDIIHTIERISASGGKSFDKSLLNNFTNYKNKKNTGTWKPNDIIDGNDVLILGSGNNLNKHSLALKSFIMKKKPKVIKLNSNTEIEDNLVDLTVACNPYRLITDLENHLKSHIPLVTSISQIDPSIFVKVKNKKILDFGFSIVKDTFKVYQTECIIPSSLAFAYALAISNSGGSKTIYLAGFDGYNYNDQRQLEMNDLVQNYESNKSFANLISLTPTNYQIKINSVYSF